MERARVNARMLQRSRQGWALDDTHQSHVTTLQRYVHTAGLGKVYETVEKRLAATDMIARSCQAIKIAHADWGFPGYGPAAAVRPPGDLELTSRQRMPTGPTGFVLRLAHSASGAGCTPDAFSATTSGEPRCSLITLRPPRVLLPARSIQDQLADGRSILNAVTAPPANSTDGAPAARTDGRRYQGQFTVADASRISGPEYTQSGEGPGQRTSVYSLRSSCMRLA